MGVAGSASLARRKRDPAGPRELWSMELRQLKPRLLHPIPLSTPEAHTLSQRTDTACDPSGPVAECHTFSRRYSGDGISGGFPKRVRTRNHYSYGPSYGGGGGNRTHVRSKFPDNISVRFPPTSNLAPEVSDGRDSSSASLGKSFRRSAEAPVQRASRVIDGGTPLRGPRRGHRWLSKQPEPTHHWQLCCRPFLTRPRAPRHAVVGSNTPSKPIAPVSGGSPAPRFPGPAGPLAPRRTRRAALTFYRMRPPAGRVLPGIG